MNNVQIYKSEKAELEGRIKLMSYIHKMIIDGANLLISELQRENKELSFLNDSQMQIIKLQSRHIVELKENRGRV